MEKTLQEIILKKHQVIAWNLVADQLMKAEVSLQSIVSKNIKELHFTVPSESLPQIKEMISGSGKMNFFIPFKGLMFTAEMKSFSENKLVTTLPFVSDFQDRRSEARIDAINIAIEFDLNGKKFTKNCFNLSAGGFSVMFMKSENLRDLEQDSEVNITLKYKNQHIPIKAKVVGVASVKAYEHESIPFAGNRYSFEFFEISPENKMLLNTIIVANK